MPFTHVANCTPQDGHCCQGSSIREVSLLHYPVAFSAAVCLGYDITMTYYTTAMSHPRHTATVSSSSNAQQQLNPLECKHE